MRKLKRHTEVIDDKFASIVLSNQMSFHQQGYRLKYFKLPNPEKYPKHYPFTTDVQKYINRVAGTRLEVYKHAMRDIEAVTTESIVSTNYMNLIRSSCREFLVKGYSHENLMEFCADVCTFSRCAYMKGLNPSKYWPILLIAEVLFILRRGDSFLDSTYSELDAWLLLRVSRIERETGPLDLNPIKLSLEWVNYSLPEYTINIWSNSDVLSYAESSSPRSHVGNIEEGTTRNLETIEEGTTRNLETIEEGITRKFVTLLDMQVESESSEDISGHSETSDEYPGNYATTSDDNSEGSETTENVPRRRRTRKTKKGKPRTSERKKATSEGKPKTRKPLYLRL